MKTIHPASLALPSPLDVAPETPDLRRLRVDSETVADLTPAPFSWDLPEPVAAELRAPAAGVDVRQLASSYFGGVDRRRSAALSAGEALLGGERRRTGGPRWGAARTLLGVVVVLGALLWNALLVVRPHVDALRVWAVRVGTAASCAVIVAYAMFSSPWASPTHEIGPDPETKPLPAPAEPAASVEVVAREEVPVERLKEWARDGKGGR